MKNTIQLTNPNGTKRKTVRNTTYILSGRTVRVYERSKINNEVGPPKTREFNSNRKALIFFNAA